MLELVLPPPTAAATVTAAAEPLSWLAIGISCIALHLWLRPMQQGFSPADPSIRRPLLPPLLSLSAVLLVSFVAPSLLICLLCPGTDHRVSTFKRFSFAFLTNVLVMLFAKRTVGRLRPHFLAAAAPDLLATPSDRFISAAEGSAYASDRRSGWDARRSFFSGHASLGSGSAVFLVLLMQQTCARSLVRSTVQAALLLTGLHAGVTQAQRFWHHWTDVVTGYAVGAALSLLAFHADL